RQEIDMLEILGGILVSLLLILLSGLKVVKEHDRLVVYRLGKIKHAKGPGLQMVVPIIDRAHTVDIRVATVPVPTVDTTTRDNHIVRVAAVCMTQVIDPVKAIKNVAEPEKATIELVQSTLISVVHHHGLKELLHERHHIARLVKKELDKRTKEWGTRIKSIEL